MSISVIGSNFSNARFSDVVRPFAAKFSVDSIKSISRCSWNRFAHAQRNFRRTRPNQFHVAAGIVRPCAAKFSADPTKSISRCSWNRFAHAQRKIPYLTWDFVEGAQRKVRCTWPKKFHLRLEISLKECSEQFAGLRNRKSQLKDVLVSKKH